MKFIPLRGIAGIVAAGVSLLAAPAVASESSLNPNADNDPYGHETPAQRDARMKWWRDARFGMFIHWGVYSVPAGTYNGKQIAGIGEWIMNRGKIPMAEYREYARQFNPVKYDADAWVRLAKEAGMKYIVITSKHHDGFAMFDSQASDWNIMDVSPFGRDPLKELAVACEKHGVKLGFYYSQAQDWNNGGSANGGKWDPAQAHSMDDYIDKVAVPQVREILTGYGKSPAVLWWDTPTDMNKERADKLIALLKLKPGIVHNNRLGGGYRGDTETPEQFVPATGYPGRDWETCMTMNDTWGYKSYDQNWKSTTVLIRNLVDIASKGGNYLLNVGPTSEGLIPEPSIERLHAIGLWMKTNGVAIYGTSASPFKRLPWGRCTQKAGASGSPLVSPKYKSASRDVARVPATLYLHVFTWPTDGKLLVPGLKSSVRKASLLAERNRALVAENTADGLIVSVPEMAPDKISSTIVLELEGAPEVEQKQITQDYDGTVILQAGEARFHGNQIQYEAGSRHDNIGAWSNPDDWADWEIEVTKPGRFDVSVEVSAIEGAGLEVVAGDTKISRNVAGTGDFERFRTVRLGSLEIASPGKVTLSLRAVKENWNPLKVRSVRLRPSATQ